jgi:hypothetical protein
MANLAFLLQIYLELKDPIGDIFADQTIEAGISSPSNVSSSALLSPTITQQRALNQERRMNKVVRRAMFLELGISFPRK